jgi:dihydrofolate reductase
VLLSLIVAMDRNGVIGDRGRLPWRLPADLRRFRALTMGKPLLMGRATHESIGRPLPGRENIVLSRDRRYRSEGCTVMHDAGDALRHCAGATEVMVMGGADLYRQFLERAGRIYLTEVHAELSGDTYFPSFDRDRWREAAREDHPADGENEYPYSFVILERAGVCSGCL